MQLLSLHQTTRTKRRMANSSFLIPRGQDHFAATTLFLKGIPEAIIAKMTGHKSRELRRYEHLFPALKQQTVELIAGELGGEVTDSPTDTPSKREHVSSRKSLINGGADGTRTRDLRRDRPAF